jgi:capsule polysaccharide export protein KpsE/RkpR
MAEKIPSWIERLLLPRLSSMEGELKAINARIDSVKTEMNAKFETVNTKIESLDKRLDVVQRLSVLEAKVRDLEKKSPQ